MNTMQKRNFNSARWAVTLLELVVVVLIILILSTTAIGVYSGQVNRARIAAAHNLIRQLDVAIARYEMDTGVLPPSGSGTWPTTTFSDRVDGSGYLHLALVHSLSGSATRPASILWHGPYLNVQADQISASTTATPLNPGMMNLLDPWNMPIHYVQNADYVIPGLPTVDTPFTGGTFLFTTVAPASAETIPITGLSVNPNLPAPNPFVLQGETYYNPTTFQLISYGPDGRTLATTAQIWPGTEIDDITNFGY